MNVIIYLDVIVSSSKNTLIFIPFSDRMEVVRARF